MKLFIVLFIITLAVYHTNNKDIEFNINPGTFSACEQSGNRSTVSWNITREHVTTVNVFVNGMGERQSLWTSGNHVGSVETGPWVVDGLTFTLKDQNNKALAKRTVETTRCTSNLFGQ